MGSDASPQTRPERPRVTFLITELDSGGAERALVRIATGLASGDWDRSVICLGDRGELVEPLEDAGIPVTCLGARRVFSPRGLWRATVGLTRELKRQQPAVLQTFLWHANFAGRLAARRAHVPHVVSGIRVAERRGRWRLRLDRWTEKSVERHVCVSHDVASFSIRESGLDPLKMVVIPNGVDFDHFRDAAPADLSEFGIPTDATVLLTVGRLDPQKNPLALVRVVGRLASERSNLHLLFVGQGPMETDITRAAVELGVTDRVHLAGWQPNVAGLMRAADVFVFASQWEGMPNVLLEAGATGLPIVATRAEGVSEIVEDRVTGRLVDTDDDQSLTTAIAETLRGQSQAGSAAAKLQDIIARDFTWPNVVSRYDSLYRSLIGGQEPRSPTTDPSDSIDD